MQMFENPTIKRFMELLAIDPAMKTDPEMVRFVLKNDMMLDTFSPAALLVRESLEKPVALGPMLEKTVQGILNRQPAVLEFMEAALEANLIEPVDTEKGKETIKRSLHHAYIMNEITKEIVRNVDFVFAIQEHLLNQREKFGISKNFIDALEVLKKIYNGSMFEPTKIIGMDMVYRKRGMDRKLGYMSDEAVKAQIDGLRLNILEASITDKNKGFMDNALAGAVLSAIPPATVSLTDDEEKVMLFHLSQKWTSLYETWNLAFVIGNLQYCQVLVPKLLIPEVIDAEPERYLITRSAALWMSTLFHQFAVLTKRADAPIPHVEELAAIWGRINRRYAEELALSEGGKGISSYEGELNITMGQIMEAMKGSITSVPLTEEESKRVAAVYA